ncbi:MAG: hypothetical protein ACYC35_26570, partial [Pirellulales bacterium]
KGRTEEATGTSEFGFQCLAHLLVPDLPVPPFSLFPFLLLCWCRARRGACVKREKGKGGKRRKGRTEEATGTSEFGFQCLAHLLVPDLPVPPFSLFPFLLLCWCLARRGACVKRRKGKGGKGRKDKTEESRP